MGTSGELNVALVALVISLFALVVATVQLLTQLFGTADGTRKCSTSVLGEWGKLTRWRWRWSEGRFETLYIVPEIFLGETPFSALEGPVIGMATTENYLNVPAESEYSKGRQKGDALTKYRQRPKLDMSDQWSRHWLAKPDPALERLMVQQNEKRLDNELAGWVSFLQLLHQNSDSTLKSVGQGNRNLLNSSIMCWPCLVFRQKSWDFMPPDVVRPLASSNISDFAIMVRRLGLVWKDFDPAKGQMNAEGGCHVISSVTIRGIGLVLQYKNTTNNIDPDSSTQIKQLVGKRKLVSKGIVDLADRQINIWSREIDKILFGILPGNKALGLPDFCIATLDDCMEVLAELNERNKSISQHVKKEGWFSRYEFNDLISFAAPVFRQRGTINQNTPLKHYWACLFTFEPAFITFAKCLRNFNHTHGGGTSQTKWVLENHEYLQPIWGGSFETSDPFPSLLERLEYLHDLYDSTTRYFQDLEIREKSRIKYYDLIKAHFSKAPLASAEARSKSDVGRARTDPDYKGGHAWRVENMYLYFDYIPDYISFMIEKGCHDSLLISEAWITLVFRALCWQKLHRVKDLDGGFLPTEYYGSQQPIYLG